MTITAMASLSSRLIARPLFQLHANPIVGLARSFRTVSTVAAQDTRILVVGSGLCTPPVVDYLATNSRLNASLVLGQLRSSHSMNLVLPFQLCLPSLPQGVYPSSFVSVMFFVHCVLKQLRDSFHRRLGGMPPSRFCSP